MLKLLRKGILLYILLLVAGGHWLSVKRTTSWERPLQVIVHPLNGDGSPRSDEYIGRLAADAFDEVAAFIGEEAAHHGGTLDEPLRMVLGETVTDQPPIPPAGGSTLSIMLWSLKLRYWAWQVDRGDDPPTSDIEIYVRYFDPDRHPRLAHSLGLQKGLIGVVNAYASRDQAGSNRVVIAHEILHTLGATDKYDPGTGQPVYPDGYAEPDASPRHPQELAELMGGRIPLTPATATTPVSLQQVVVGLATARGDPLALKWHHLALRPLQLHEAMTLRILHTADWQIGKRFGFVPEEGDKAAALRLERFEAVARIARLATAREVDAVLVAGDVFEHDELSDETLRRTINRMSHFEGPWVLLPGNHDPAFSENVWTRLARSGQLPSNVVLATRPVPIELCDGALSVLPAPLTRRHEFRDLTGWFDSAETRTGCVRIGLAHGSVSNRLPPEARPTNVISDTRADSAGLDYLALGDWHGTLEIAPRTWYSGTPEPERFRANDPGNVLLVEVDAPGAMPRVTRERTGRFSWHSLQHTLHHASDLEALQGLFEGLGEAPQVLLNATLTGSLDLATRQRLQDMLDAWAARFHCLLVDDASLGVDPSEEDLASFNAAGFVGEAAHALRECMAAGHPERDAAREALRILFLEKARLES